MTLLDELDAVMENLRAMVELRNEGEEIAAGHYQREFQRFSADFLRDNAPAIRAALELAEVVKNGVRETVYAGGVVDCIVPLEYGTEVIIIPAPPSLVGGDQQTGTKE